MATHSSVLARKIPWTEEPGGLYSPQGCKESDRTEVTEYTSILSIVSGFLVNIMFIILPVLLDIVADYLFLLLCCISLCGYTDLSVLQLMTICEVFILGQF